MLLHFKMNVLIKIFFLVVCLPNIKSDCSIKYTNDMDIAPIFERAMGKFKIKIPFRSNDGVFAIKVQEGENVHGYCNTFFSPIVYETTETVSSYPDYRWREPSYEYKRVEKTISNQTALVLKCIDGTLLYQDHKLVGQTLSCMQPIWKIYSAKKQYNWCENNKNSSTFLLAVHKLAEKNVLAALCYNIYQMSLQTVVYNTTYLQQGYFNKLMNTNTANMISSNYLDEELWNFKTSIVSDLSETVLQKKLSQMSKTEEWLNLAKYEVSLISQDELIMKFFKGYENILNIIWWHNLRVGNWKRFQNSLTNYAHNNSYELYLGTSGVVQYPTEDKCNKERYLELNLGFQNQTVPAYIWTYLKSNDNLNKDFVMVGFNSPYAEYFTTEKIIFCPDICSQIPWLKEISASFRYAYAGIMFCCSTDFISQTNYLQGFPIEILPPQQISTTTLSSTVVESFPTEIVNDLSKFMRVQETENELKSN